MRGAKRRSLRFRKEEQTAAQGELRSSVPSSAYPVPNALRYIMLNHAMLIVSPRSSSCAQRDEMATLAKSQLTQCNIADE